MPTPADFSVEPRRVLTAHALATLGAGSFSIGGGRPELGSPPSSIPNLQPSVASNSPSPGGTVLAIVGDCQVSPGGRNRLEWELPHCLSSEPVRHDSVHVHMWAHTLPSYTRKRTAPFFCTLLCSFSQISWTADLQAGTCVCAHAHARFHRMIPTHLKHF